MAERILDQVMNATVEAQEPQIHIFFDGQTFDIPLRELEQDIGVRSPHDQIRSAAAARISRVLNTPLEKIQNALRLFVVVPNEETGSIDIRPHATWGS